LTAIEQFGRHGFETGLRARQPRRETPGRTDRTFRAGPAQQGAHSKGNHGAIVLAIHIRDEEQLLGKELAGCREYTQRVRYRLVPYVW
jgi:hypothetical protein